MRKLLILAIIGCTITFGLADFEFTDSQGRCWSCDRSCVPCSDSRWMPTERYLDEVYPRSCPLPDCNDPALRGGLLFPVPSDPRFYYKCVPVTDVLYGPQIMSCPPEQFFVAELQRCEFPWEWDWWCTDLPFPDFIPPPFPNPTNGPLPTLPDTTQNPTNSPFPTMPGDWQNPTNGPLPTVPGDWQNPTNGPLPTVPGDWQNPTNSPFPTGPTNPTQNPTNSPFPTGPTNPTQNPTNSPFPTWPWPSDPTQNPTNSPFPTGPTNPTDPTQSPTNSPFPTLPGGDTTAPCIPCMPCMPCMIWWMCQPCHCGMNGCSMMMG